MTIRTIKGRIVRHYCAGGLYSAPDRTHSRLHVGMRSLRDVIGEIF